MVKYSRALVVLAAAVLLAASYESTNDRTVQHTPAHTMPTITTNESMAELSQKGSSIMLAVRPWYGECAFIGIHLEDRTIGVVPDFEPSGQFEQTCFSWPRYGASLAQAIALQKPDEKKRLLSQDKATVLYRDTNGKHFRVESSKSRVKDSTFRPVDKATPNLKPKVFLWQESKLGWPLVIAFQKNQILLCELDLRNSKISARVVYEAEHEEFTPNGTAITDRRGTVFYTSIAPEPSQRKNGETLQVTRVNMLDAGAVTTVGAVVHRTSESVELVSYIQ